jgi:azurin
MSDGPTHNLVCTMETELANLMLDMGQLDACKEAYTKEDCRKLAAHTQILNELNERAHTMMVLTTFATS